MHIYAYLSGSCIFQLLAHIKAYFVDSLNNQMLKTRLRIWKIGKMRSEETETLEPTTVNYCTVFGECLWVIPWQSAKHSIILKALLTLCRFTILGCIIHVNES